MVILEAAEPGFCSLLTEAAYIYCFNPFKDPCSSKHSLLADLCVFHQFTKEII